MGVGLVLAPVAPVAAAGTTGIVPGEAGMASGLLNSSRQLGGCVGLAVLATVAAHRTGTPGTPAALDSGYALSLSVAAGLFLLAAVVAAAVLPRGTAPAGPRAGAGATAAAAAGGTGAAAGAPSAATAEAYASERPPV
ncbi:hypothetical protein [Streptomyces sp. NPDC049040]|uniref:hypothetical protein n=1 Tax=Streptomyces sp. NPDC049040 TaxID=3365593 RepID=UPI0037155B02